MSTPFISEYVYDATIENVWQALTDKAKMREWYFYQILQFVPVVGFEFMFANDGSEYMKEWRVTKVVDGRLLAHTWSYIGYPGRSEVTFELFEAGDKTRLRLTHTGLESFPDDPHFARQRFVDGWAQILGWNLKRVVEGGL